MGYDHQRRCSDAGALSDRQSHYEPLNMDFIHYAVGRWIHIAAGFMWVGLLYYFNFVNVAAAKAAAADGTGAVIGKHIMPRALLFFRWSAVVTWLAGAYLLGAHFLDAFLFRAHSYVPIGVGAWLGTIMLFNVWAISWPSQKILLGMTQSSTTQKAKALRVAFLASRFNVMLSLPLLFFMSASGGLFRAHYF